MSQRDIFIPGLGAAAITAAEYADYGHMLGAVKVDEFGNRYKFVKSDNVNGAVLGALMYLRDIGESESDMTDDIAVAGPPSGDAVRGVAASTFSGTNVYGWMMIEGDLETALNGAGMTLTTDGGVVQGDLLASHASTDNTVIGLAKADATDAVVWGIAGADDATTSLTKGRIFTNAPSIIAGV